MSESKRKKDVELRNRMKANKPNFRRLESWRYKRIKTGWRWPRGKSRMRIKIKSSPKLPSIGFRISKGLRDLHPSGFREVLVQRPDELDKVDSKKEAVRIAGRIGEKKRRIIIERATNLNLKILNIGTIEEISEIPEVEESTSDEKEAKKVKEKQK